MNSSAPIRVSIIVAVTERPEPLAPFYEEYAAVLKRAGLAFEWIVVAAALERGLLDDLKPLIAAGEPVRCFEAANNIGETALLRSVLPFCQGEIVVTLPAYRRVLPEGILALIARIDDNQDLVTARREVPGQSAREPIQRRIAHALIRSAIGGSFHDLGSGVRAFRVDVIRQLPLYGEFSRFLPLFALRDGFRTLELGVPQHPMDVRTRVYSPGIYVRRLLDLFAVYFLVRFREKPLRFFGLTGGLTSLVGFALLAVLAVQRAMGQPLADRPLLVLSVLLVVLGVQGIALGLVGEIIVHASVRRGVTYRLAPRWGR
jgi:hypothetical protein